MLAISLGYILTVAFPAIKEYLIPELDTESVIVVGNVGISRLGSFLLSTGVGPSARSNRLQPLLYVLESRLKIYEDKSEPS